MYMHSCKFDCVCRVDTIQQCVYVGHTMRLPPQAVSVNQHLIYISMPDHIWVIIVYMGLDREQLTCSIHGNCLVMGKKEGGGRVI